MHTQELRDIDSETTTNSQRTLGYLVDSDNEGIDVAYYESFPDDSDRINVPAAWNAKYDDHESPIWYRRRFAIPDPGPTRIAFQGACHDPTVWLNGN